MLAHMSSAVVRAREAASVEEAQGIAVVKLGRGFIYPPHQTGDKRKLKWLGIGSYGLA